MESYLSFLGLYYPSSSFARQAEEPAFDWFLSGIKGDEINNLYEYDKFDLQNFSVHRNTLAALLKSSKE